MLLLLHWSRRRTIVAAWTGASCWGKNNKEQWQQWQRPSEHNINVERMLSSSIANYITNTLIPLALDALTHQHEAVVCHFGVIFVFWCLCDISTACLPGKRDCGGSGTSVAVIRGAGTDVGVVVVIVVDGGGGIAMFTFCNDNNIHFQFISLFRHALSSARLWHLLGARQWF